MTADDTARIRAAEAYALAAADPEAAARHARTGAHIADQLRQQLPHDPDPVIARILATAATTIWSWGAGLNAHQVASGLALAAADLAHFDLDEGPPP